MTEKIIFACDYDGTYRYGEENGPVDSDVEAVRRFRENGGIFGIVTERDMFEMMAVVGLLRGEYDFIVCSSGACAIVRTSDMSVGVSMGSVGVEGDLPVRLYYNGINQHLVHDVVGILQSVSVDNIVVDTTGFMGGYQMASDFCRAFDPLREIGSKVHFWYGDGQFFQEAVEREALRYIFPVSRLTARFKNSIIADGAISAIWQKYPGKFRVHRSGSCFDLTVPEATKSYGIGQVLEFYGASSDSVWTCGDSARDAGMLGDFKGIAISGGAPEAVAAAKYTAGNVAEAIDIIERSNS